MKNRKIQIVYISLFMSVLLLPSIIWGSIKLFGSEKLLDSISVNLEENRLLAEFPDSFNPKTITSELEAYYNDHVPFRTNVISFKNRLISSMEKTYADKIEPVLINVFYPNSGEILGGGEIEIPDGGRVEVLAEGEKDCNHILAPREIETEAGCETEGRYIDSCLVCGFKIRRFVSKTHIKSVIKTIEPSYEHYGFTLYECSSCGEQFKGDFKQKLIDMSYKPPRLFANTVIRGRYDWFFYVGDNSVGYYRNTNTLSEETMNEWTLVLDELQGLCDEKGIKLSVIVCPNKEQVYSEYMPSYDVVSGKKRTEILADYISLNSSVNFRYIFDEVAQNKIYYDTYFKYDTHWNDVGAFLGTQAIYKSLGYETTDLTSLEISEEPYSYGDLLSIGNLSSAVYKNDTKYTVHYRDEIECLTSGEFYTGTVRSTCNEGNGEKIVLIGDSFRNLMVQYLAKDFSDGTYTHKTKIQEVLEDVKDTDVLVIEAVERYDYETVNTAKTLIEFLKAQ